MGVIKKIGLSAVALSLTASMAATPVFADDDDYNKYDKYLKNNKQQTKFKHQAILFKDVEAEDWEWAIKAIIKMKGKGVFTGYLDGTFLPNKPINRVEAVVAAVRLMGLEAEAKAKGDLTLNFKDAKEIDRKFGWAEGYIAVGLEKGLFDSSLDMFQPEKPATREWVATLLVRALDLETEALAKMNAKLSFKDSREISAGAVGFVAIAVEKGLIKGYEDGSFKPNKPITRAEMATLLDRLDWMEDDFTTGVRGTIYMISPDKEEIVIQKSNGAYVNVELEDETYIYLNGQPATVADIKPGYTVTVVFDDEGDDALLIDVRSDVPVYQALTGTIDQFVLPTQSSNGSLEIDLGSEDKTFTLTSQTKVSTEGLNLHLSDLREDQEVTVKLEGNVIKEIVVKGTVRSFDGVLKQVNPATSTQPASIVITKNNTDTVYSFAQEVTISYNNTLLRLSDLNVGDSLEIKTFNGLVKEVKVKQKYEVGVYQGTIERVVLPTTSTNGSIVVDLGSEDKTFTLTTQTVVKTNGLNLHLTDLKANQVITFAAEGQVVKEVQVQGTVNTVEGVLKQVIPASSTQAAQFVLTTSSGDQVYPLAQQVTVSYNNEAIRLSNLTVGDKLEIKTFNGFVKEVKVEQKYETAVYTGSIESFTLPTSTNQGSIVVDIGAQDLTFVLNQNTKVKTTNLDLHFSDLAVNQDVTLRVENSLVKEIHVDGDVLTFQGEVKAVQAPTLTNQGSITLKRNNQEQTYLFAKDITLTMDDETVLLSDVAIGDTVEITTFNAKVKVIDIKDKRVDATYTGTVQGIILPTQNQTGILSLQLSNSQVMSVRIDQNVSVLKNNEIKALVDIQIGATLKIELKDNVVKTIIIQD